MRASTATRILRAAGRRTQRCAASGSSAFADVAEDEVLVTYELTKTDGRVFRNTEILTLREGRIVLAEVYFGWDVNA